MIQPRGSLETEKRLDFPRRALSEGAIPWKHGSPYGYLPAALLTITLMQFPPKPAVLIRITLGIGASAPDKRLEYGKPGHWDP